MKSAIAVVAMAALCALASAAPLGSQPHQPHSVHPAVPLFEIPLDPDLEGPFLDGDQIPGLHAEVALAGGLPPSPFRAAFVPVMFGSGTLAAFAGLFLVTSHNLRTRPGRRKRLEYVTRMMSPII